MTKIVVCGGHLTPALALIEELEGKKNLKLIFFGRKYSTEGSKNYSAEYEVIRKKHIKFYSIRAGRIQRKITRYTLFSIFKIPVGFFQSFIFLLIERPKLIVSFGGYLSTPIIISGWLLGIDSITHEQSTIPGLATKINSLFVKKIFLSWGSTRKYFESSKIEVAGNLIRKSLFSKNPRSKEIADFLKTSKKIILVIGGNQGSHVLNLLIFALIKKISDFYCLHQVGTANWQQDHQIAKSIKRPNYLAVGYIAPEDFGAVLNRADLVIARSGANTIWDLAILKKPAILVPLPLSAGDEQAANAQILKKAGIAEIVGQKNLTPEAIKSRLLTMLKNLKKYQEHAQIFSQTLPIDATQKIVKFILSYT